MPRELLDLLKHEARLFEKCMARFGEPDLAARAIEQFNPSAASSPAIDCDNGGWVMPRRAAARRKCNSSTMAMKWRR
jgi:hypothetical protein